MTRCCQVRGTWREVRPGGEGGTTGREERGRKGREEGRERVDREKTSGRVRVFDCEERMRSTSTRYLAPQVMTDTHTHVY